ncbi:RNA ligase family protein [Flavivirga eckloniae]|uniref:2'-5' RNA ligase n=1 Tax=Flavivirga eckloniae TaxID=1803846 RepID=A0A2K9PVX5_9FLAO|nr:RNA ligase family protein [Flavivirga eckloniae]AUP81203.1 2'-5' RNA ligase [Flavivirga eckloniae]
MSEFSGYEKMPSSLKKLGLSENDFSKMEKLKWVVTEKVHGANFSFVYENRTLKFAKRKEYLSWNDDFFGFQLVVREIEGNIIRLFEDLSSNNAGDKYIVYGELFGGEYPHEDVQADNNVNAIQTGVYYSPSIKFCAFDIAVEKDNSKYYLDYETAISYFEKHNLFHAKPLLIGKFRDAMNFNTRINSTIPKQLGIRELQDNLIEGVVVKPFNQQLNDRSISSRPIVKLKNREFDEENKFHQAEKWSYIPNVSSKTEDLAFILDELRNYITVNRLESAISKVGALDIDNQQRLKDIVTECVQDILIDFNENNDNLLKELSFEDNDWIIERVSSEVRELINTANNV